MTVTTSFSPQQKPPGVSQTVYESAGTGVDTATLVWMIQSKNERSFNILYDKYCDALYGILMKFVRRTDVADDLLQDVFCEDMETYWCV